MYENGKVSEIMEDDLPLSEGSEDKCCVCSIGSNDCLNSFERV